MVLRSYVGASVKRKEDPRLITGSSVYVDDLVLPGMVHLAIVRSPYAHARITGIDASEALAMPGVVAVVTARDLEAILANKYPVESYEGPGEQPEDQAADEAGDGGIPVPGIEPHILYPMKTWKDKAAFDETARRLVRMFQENFVKYEKHVDADVRSAAPEVRIAAE